jgi:hypothetical protein
MKLQSTRFGLAFAIVGVVMYLGCMMLMTILGQEGTVWFFNSILHGFDVSSCIRMDVSIIDTAAGIVFTGLIGMFVGWGALLRYTIN